MIAKDLIKANPLLFDALAHVEPDWVAPSDAVGKAFRGSAMEAPVDALPQPG